jgi:hypothetical protein
MHAEAIIQQLHPGAQMGRPFGWRTLSAAVSYGQNLWMMFLVLLRGVPFF